MPNINMQNTVGLKTATKPVNTPKNEPNYFKGLKNTWAFSQNLKDYTFGFKTIILLVRLLTFVFYSIFYLIKFIIFFVIGLCQRNKVIK